MIKEIVESLINPKARIEKRLNLKNELLVKFNKSLYLKDYLKTKAWLEYDRPKIQEELEAGIKRLLSDGMAMKESDIKAVLAYMKSITDRLAQMRFDIENGEEAGIKLDKLK